jgi:tetratricopeptide (TPR) repeat protein
MNKLPDDQKMLNTFAWALCMIDSALVPALSMIDRAIESNGGCDLSYRNTRGVVLLKLNRLDEAEAELNASLADETVRLQSVNHFYLGQLWNKRGNKEKAKEHFTISSELRGDRKYIARAKAELEKL